MTLRLTLLLLLLAAPKIWAGTPGQLEAREGDEIVVAGQFFHTGTKVVLWLDPGGYDGYRVERRFVPIAQADWDSSKLQMAQPRTPNRYSTRGDKLSAAQLEQVRGGGWDLPLLQSTVDQFVLHFDVEGTSHACFKILQDRADLSIHLMLDLDGTIYQTLDLKERARHATSSNNRSIGVEIANVGAYPAGDNATLNLWYKKEADGHVHLSLPPAAGQERTPNFQGGPARRDIITGQVQDKTLRQYDYTPQQYAALAKLTATVCSVFPKIKCDYPRDAQGHLVLRKLPPPQLRAYQGVLGHYHIQTDKEDPGPALQWDFIIDNARTLLHLPPVPNVDGQPVTTPVALLQDN